jgi:hypothetical protein
MYGYVKLSGPGGKVPGCRHKKVSGTERELEARSNGTASGSDSESANQLSPNPHGVRACGGGFIPNASGLCGFHGLKVLIIIKNSI